MDLRTLLIGAICIAGLSLANTSIKSESESEAENFKEHDSTISSGSSLLFSFATKFLLAKKPTITESQPPVPDKETPVIYKKPTITESQPPVPDIENPVIHKKYIVHEKQFHPSYKKTHFAETDHPAKERKFSSLNEETVVESLEARPRSPKINIEIDPNDFENNEIDGSSNTKKPIKKVEEEKEESNDWFSYILKFFGYKSFGDLVKNVDIFSIPEAIQNATRTYKEEIGLGQCYMEFTTFSVFSQEGSVFHNSTPFRSKRDASEHTSEHLVEESRATDNGQANMINNLAQTVISMLQKSPATAKYGTTIKQLLPMVMEVIGNDNPQQAMIQFATKNLLPLISSFASGGGQSNKVVKEKITYQNQPPSYIKNTVQSPSSSPSSSASSALSPLLSLASQFLLGGGNRKPSPAKRPHVPVKKTQITKAQEKVDKKTSFAQTILDFIRPLFISIVGDAPGKNGVEILREMANLQIDPLSRIQVDKFEEVTSPYFCAKNYMINKAWSLTENGVDYVVGYIDSAQQERMSRMLTNYYVPVSHHEYTLDS